MGNVNVFALDTLSMSIRNLNTGHRETGSRCDEGLRDAEQVLQQTQEELQISEALLAAAQAEEAAKLALQLKADARMAAALAEEATAVASCNPFAIAAASAEVAAAAAELAQATDEYRQAREHRERLEHRYELARRCIDIAQQMLDTLRMRFQYGRTKIDEIIFIGCSRLQSAHDDLERYLSRISPQARQQLDEYQNWKPQEKKPVTPSDVHDRLNPKDSVIDGLLEYLYVTDCKFHDSVKRLCVQLNTPENVASVEAKIKKNVVGRVCEELLIRAFIPMGERIETQHICYLDNGSFTKVDMILYGLKEPLILGRGEGMSGKKGGSLAIEVKAGRAAYIYNQTEHMELQAKGHQSCDVSCTVCTRDIKDLPPEQEEELRRRLREAGSPILGMLPKKAELDERCIRFVKGKAADDNV